LLFSIPGGLLITKIIECPDQSGSSGSDGREQVGGVYYKRLIRAVKRLQRIYGVTSLRIDLAFYLTWLQRYWVNR